MLDMWVILRGCRRSYVGVSVLLEEAPAKKIKVHRPLLAAHVRHAPTRKKAMMRPFKTCARL